MKHITNEEFEARLETILELWDDHSLEYIAEKLGCTRQNVSSWVLNLRKKGLLIPTKSKWGGHSRVYRKIAEKYKGKYGITPNK